MDKKLTLIIAFWLSGVIAGVLLLARWMRLDQRLPEPATQDTDAGTDAAGAATTEEAHGLHRFTEPIVSGAKADAVRVRRVCTRVTHKVASTIGREPKTEEPETTEAIPALQ